MRRDKPDTASLRWLTATCSLLLAACGGSLSTRESPNAPGDEAGISNGALQVSRSPDRSGAVVLDGQALSGLVYIFTAFDKEARGVTFYIDDPNRLREPRSREYAAPWDLGGTSADGRALPFDVSTLAAGTHTIAAHIELTSGLFRDLIAQISVTGGGSGGGTGTSSNGSGGGTGTSSNGSGGGSGSTVPSANGGGSGANNSSGGGSGTVPGGSGGGVSGGSGGGSTGVTPVGLTSGGNDTTCIFNKATQPVTQAFCDGFNTVYSNPAGSRSGQLNGKLWGVSRLKAGEDENHWYPATLSACGATRTVYPPNDVVICDGQLHEVVNDGHGVTTLAIYPKQPFDYAGRTGTVVFDVSNDSAGSHAAWPEFWLTDKPVPASRAHFEPGFKTVPRHGFGLSFGATCKPSEAGNCGPNCKSDGVHFVTSLDQVKVYRSYVEELMPKQKDNCVMHPGPGELNHYEIQVSQNEIVVWASDPYTGVWNPATKPLKRLGIVSNANLTTTRGLIWIEDAHYNGDKQGFSELAGQSNHMFRWDNVGFDGPKTYRDLAYDVPDANNACVLSGAASCPPELGWRLTANATQSLTVPNIVIGNPTSALITYNLGYRAPPTSLKFSVNGHLHDEAIPFPNMAGWQLRNVDLPIPVSEIVNGDNTIVFYGQSPELMSVANVNLIMVAGAPVP